MAAAGAGQLPDIRAGGSLQGGGGLRWQGSAGTPSCLPARAAVPTTLGCWLRVSVWWHQPSPAIWCPATADCAQQAPRRHRAPPAAAPGAYGPGLPSAPLPGAAGPEAPAGMPGATWHSPGSLKVHPQPSLPTCSRCCLQACISCRWLCSKASRSHSAASRSLRAASRLRPSVATSFCQRAASHCGEQGRGQGSSGVSFLPGATLPWESSAREGEPGAHLSARLLA